MKAHIYLLTGDISSTSINDLIKFMFDKIHVEIKPKFFIYISSTGGDIDSAIRFYDFARSLDADIITIGFAQVDSAAAPVFLAGHKRMALKNTRFRIHEPMFNGKTYPVNIETYKEIDNFFSVMKNRYFEILAESLNKSKKELELEYKEGQILTTEEALKFGFIHNIVEKLPVIHQSMNKGQSKGKS